MRRTLRARRRALDGRAQRQAALGAAERLTRLPAWRRARRVALYLPADGELDPSVILRRAWHEGRRICLPVLRPDGALAFRRLTADTPLRANRLGLLEPAGPRAVAVPLAHLDLVLMPLVGFDAAGRRLGMGGGFYDRTLAGRGRFRRPALVGLAHECQRVGELPSESWDVPLDAVITGQRLYRFPRGGAGTR
ncbi:5-formyltetrahydrofolate cyclo-ligase [Spiribacter halobius]|uniref:5-formyltetrahydrofolate cyclo-ligase n=1 Tax=Sediminicurvatus halobius TaxID=2182432 RepID=A0A2U2N1R3_9GAMM|nr:5-formyltetrahydrofolate cyclo-ligase [Spiribacter halobius]